MMINKRGLEDQIKIIIVLGCVLGGIVLFFYIWSLAGPPAVYLVTQVGNMVQDNAFASNDPNITNAIDNSFGVINPVVAQFEWISYTIIILLFLTFIILCFYVRTYPFLAFFWIIIIIVLVLISLFMTNTYQGLAGQGGDIGNSYTSWTNSHFIMSYLPHIITVMGIIGGIIMFVVATRDREQEAAII